MSKSLIITPSQKKTLQAFKLPLYRKPTPPGVFLKQILEEYDISITDFAQRIGATRVRISEVINGKRAVTPDTALRLGMALNMSPQFWLNLQHGLDMYNAITSDSGREIEHIEPITPPVKSLKSLPLAA